MEVNGGMLVIWCVLVICGVIMEMWGLVVMFIVMWCGGD